MSHKQQKSTASTHVQVPRQPAGPAISNLVAENEVQVVAPTNPSQQEPIQVQPTGYASSRARSGSKSTFIEAIDASCLEVSKFHAIISILYHICTSCVFVLTILISPAFHVCLVNFDELSIISLIVRLLLNNLPAYK